MTAAERPPIRCDGHLLDPEVTIDCRQYDHSTLRATHRAVMDPTVVIIRCKKCGNEVRTDEYFIHGIPLPERTWP